MCDYFPQQNSKAVHVNLQMQLHLVMCILLLTCRSSQHLTVLLLQSTNAHVMLPEISWEACGSRYASVVIFAV